jgi:hypothetical protein
MDRGISNRQITPDEDFGQRCACIGGTPARRDSAISRSSVLEQVKDSADDNDCGCIGLVGSPQAVQRFEGVLLMALVSTLLGAVRSTFSRADGGYVIPLRAVTASVMSATGKHCSSQRSRAFSGTQTEALAAAIKVEIYLESWRARHQRPEQETRRRLCSNDEF